MTTLTKFRSLLRDRLAEEGNEFWADKALDSYANLAQNFIASVTRGVSELITEEVGGTVSTFSLPARTLNAHQLSGFDTESGEALGSVPLHAANILSPSWRTLRGVRPKWVILDFDAKEGHVSPVPYRKRDIDLRVAVLPDPVEHSNDKLFNGLSVMDKYLNVTINMAAFYGLLRERFDNDAERFYGIAFKELIDLGVNPNDIPPFEEVRIPDAGDSR